MDVDKVRAILLGVSLVSIAVAILGLIFGFPFLGFFLFIPFIGFGSGFGRPKGSQKDVGYGSAGLCPECGSPVEPSDSFCRVCGRRL